MKRVLALIRHDLNSTFRDPLFKGLLFFPFVCFILVRWVFPLLFEAFPILEPYREVFVMWACMQSATMFGFIYGFLFLEEKEESLLQVLRILPLPTSQLVMMRQSIAVIISTAVNFCILEYGNILPSNPIPHLLIAFQLSLLAPLITLALTVFAGSRMEGLAQVKILNLLLTAPGLIYFIGGTGMHAMALIPSYWSFRAIEFSQEAPYGPFLWGGFAVYFGILYFLNRRFSRRIFV
ncbi:MAG: hypothetical protein LPK45_06325 [Bacteroidota bacterium]|nr:hypothetical protein [Bacteroidota bacterium]MDX5430688.1 hypothetical protein [Bacteroidota bacterium]MDX5469435.1 hypothetical protein [Bacteroidota bacterium]